ncbi:MAG TPA: DUF1294 domain-containing protein [Sulfurovum sp.]|nr:DUF1294 domain-containing protein [Sulfurovum sp.]
MLKKGILTKWNNDKGYGFITPIGEKKEVFAHVNEFKNRQIRPSLNQALHFRLSNKNGKPCAINIEIDNNSSIIRKKGILTKWNDDKGYGFITPVGEKKEVFVHISEFNNRPSIGAKLIFTLSKDKNGRDCATNAIQFDKAKLTSTIEEKNSISIFSFLIITLFYFVLFTYLPDDKNINIYAISYYILIGIFTYYLYAKDKASSQDGNWRISENTLHVFSLFGGWTGALIAQNKLKHKSSKTNFKISFFISIIFNIFLLFYIIKNLSLI